MPEALAESCDTYFYEIGNRFYEGGSESRVRMQQWARRFGFGAPTGLDIGGEADGLVPTPEWRRKTFESDWDRAWNPGDSIQLAIGQKDLLVTPLQMAAFYAMLANGGSVVKPYLVSDVEQPGAKGSPRVVLRRFAAEPPRSAGVDPEALRAVRDGLYAATHSANGTSSGVFANFAGADLGQDGHGREGRAASRLPGRPPRGSVVVVRLGAVRVGAARRVRPDRERRARLERGRSGRAQGVRAVLQRRGAAGDAGGHGLMAGPPMIEVSQRARVRSGSRRTEPAVLTFLRSLDWILMLAAAGLVGYGLWVVSGITRFDVPGDQDYFVVRQGIAAAIGAVGLVVAALVPIDLWRRYWKLVYVHDARADDRRVRRRGGRPRLEAVARPRRHPVPAVGAREGPLRARDRRLRRRPRRSGRPAGRRSSR